MKTIRQKVLPLLILAGAGMVLACRSEAQTEARVKAEIDRLQGILKKLDEKAPPQAKSELAGLSQQLDLLPKQKSPSALVYQLRNPFLEIEKRAFLQAHGDAGNDFSKVEALWTAEKAHFTVAPHPAPASPLLAGLAEAAQNHAEKLYHAALPYGKAAGPMAGVYYLGEAESNMAFRNFVVGLTLPAGDEKLPDAATLRSVLESLEGELQKDFAADPGGQEMIPASALLKEARELVERDFRAGAALTLLRCRIELSRHKPIPPAGPAQAPPEKAAEGSLLAPFAAMTAGDQDETARIIRADVVPLYRSFSRKSK